MDIHPESFRALAYEVQSLLTAGRTNDDSNYNLFLIEQELRKQTGKYYAQADLLAQRKGELPEVSRFIDDVLPIDGYGLRRDVPIDQVMFWAGKAAISFLGIRESERGFTPVANQWQLKSTAEMDNKPAFCVSGDRLIIQLTPGTVLVDHVDITYMPSSGFPNKDRADEWYWAKPWNVPLALKAEAKMNTLRVYMGTHAQLVGRADTKNNGIDG